jgi:hypothetical protein
MINIINVGIGVLKEIHAMPELKDENESKVGG